MIRKSVPFFLAVIAVANMTSGFSAEDVVDRFEAREYKTPSDGRLLYRILLPKDYDKSASYPLVLFFHGAGERGADNRKQLVHGMSDFASNEAQKKYPCFVVAPQCPENSKWVDVSWSDEQHSMPEKPADPMRLSLELIDALVNEYSIDKRRIYVTGLSMGGFGTWDALMRRPKFFAAAIPICGGGDPVQAKRIAHVPQWIFHGDMDTAVKPSRSREMVAALKAAGGSPRYTEYPKTGHDSWTATYANREVHDWLFAQKNSE